MRSSSSRLLPLFTVLAAMATMSAHASAPPPPPGNTWASIQRLPDWSGVWVKGRAGEGGVRSDSQQAPLTAKYRQISDQSASKQTLENMGRCLPAGPTAILAHGVLHEYLFTPGRVTVLYEDGEVRRIYTDGRRHLDLDELSQSYMGDSIGHWEGKTLVVDTIGFPRGELFMNNIVRATRNTHMIERITMKDRDHIEIATVITDPQIFAMPYAFTRSFKRSELPFRETGLCNTHDAGGDVDLSSPPDE
jgi:hypothetical protein